MDGSTHRQIRQQIFANGSKPAGGPDELQSNSVHLRNVSSTSTQLIFYDSRRAKGSLVCVCAWGGGDDHFTLLNMMASIMIGQAKLSKICLFTCFCNKTCLNFLNMCVVTERKENCLKVVQ